MMKLPIPLTSLLIAGLWLTGLSATAQTRSLKHPSGSIGGAVAPCDIAAETERLDVGAAPDRVTIRTKTLNIKRRGKPSSPIIHISYPLVSGVKNRTVLRKLRAALSLKAIYDVTPPEKLNEDEWLDEISYTVNYNRRSLLDVAFTISGTAAYPDGYEKRLVLNLKTGEKLRARDVFLPSMRKALAALINKSLQAEIQEAIGARANDKELGSDEMRSLFNGIQFTENKLDDFTISDKGVTFLVNYGFIHAVKAAEPPGRFFFRYARIKPYIRSDGPLGSFVRS